MLSIMLAAAASGSLLQAADGAGVRSVRASTPRPAFTWPAAQVRELIAVIQESERLGLDPADYGIAALRSELDQCEHLWGTAGSRQLDTLARASALALARDYRRRKAATDALQVSADTLDRALSSNQLRAWLTAQPSTVAEGSTF